MSEHPRGTADVLTLPGWRPLHSGKVRDLHLSESDPSRVLVVASDRISAYDHVLPTTIPDKGAILTALSLWWFERLEGWDLGVGHHVLETATGPDGVPAAVAGRAMVCRRLEMLPVECIARGYLTGSGLEDYRATGAVGDTELPPGLVDGDRLRAPIFTPTTKAEVGHHDEAVNLAAVAEMVGDDLAHRLRQVTLALYARAAELAAERGILLADTKLELGLDPSAGGALTIGDEVLTPDSSRFWPADTWSPGRSQPSFDKQYVRDWLTSPASGWQRDGAEPPPELPAEVVERTRERYVEAYQRLTGRTWG